MKFVKLTLEKGEFLEVATLPQLLEAVKGVQSRFEPPIEKQLADVYVEDYQEFEEGDNYDSVNISTENTQNGKVTTGVVKTLNDLIFTVKKVQTSAYHEFYPPLSKQLLDGGGWDEKEIEKYEDFIAEIQDSLPKDYRLMQIENKLDEYLNFWYNEASTADLKHSVIIEQFVELKKIVFK